MRDKMISAMVKLVMCPGTCNQANPDEICTICPHRGARDCEKQLRESSLVLLQKHEAKTLNAATAVQDAAAAIVICDMLSMRFGTDWLCES